MRIKKRVYDSSPLNDSEVFGNLFIQFWPRIFSLVYTRTGYNYHRAEDVAAATFELAWRRRDTFHGTTDSESFGSWLFSIAKNTAAESGRDYGRTVDTQPLDESDEKTLWQTAIWGIQHVDETSTTPATDVEAILGTLSEKCRATLHARYLEGLSVKETAALLNITESAVKIRTVRGLAQLKKQFADQPDSPDETSDAE